MATLTAAEIQFNTSSVHQAPEGYTPWAIRNDYPHPKDHPHPARVLPEVEGDDFSGLPQLPDPGRLPFDPKPWLHVDFKKRPELYCELIRSYFYEGNVENKFVLEKNKVRDWYHAPWMHYGPNGREPINGLTFERATPANELAKNQNRTLQSWACGFFNSEAASVLGGVWQNPNQPDWETNLNFPHGSLICKNIFSTATNDEVPSMNGSPVWEACIAQSPADPKAIADPKVRLDKANPVRLIQIDFAARDKRAPIGWCYGTFMYDGRHADPNLSPVKQWDNTIPVGLQWGNDPELTQEKYDSGVRPQELWLNPVALELLKELGGSRPTWGWNGRMNGPADNFVSACASCHSVAQRTTTHRKPTSLIQKPAPKKIKILGPGDTFTFKWEQQDEKETMRWFRNIPAGEPFDEDAISSDYSLQVMIGYANFTEWKAKHVEGVDKPMAHFSSSAALRAGPHMDYSHDVFDEVLHLKE
ncbi:hypothetical protein PM082_021076 [Marasmius tenuissimus]|nr:hypothetical protein PM082_021076 [Marasmius tenuissimus]